jgi:hypothetical protein
LLASLQHYAGSEAFHPKSELSAETLEKLFAPAIGGLMQRLGAKVIAADSQAADYPAENVVDGDPQTIWHTPWNDPAPPFPHYLVIEFPKPVALHGLKVLPRQDMSNGRIKDYEVFVSHDGRHWGAAVKKGKFSNSADLQVIDLNSPRPYSGEGGHHVPMVGVRAVSTGSRFLKFVALSSFENKPYASMAELEVIPATSEKR